MTHLSSLRSASLGAALALGAVGLVGSTVLMSGPAVATPPTWPKGVRVQCTEFYGPNTAFPHFLKGCTRRNGDTGLGQTEKLNGIETLIWYLPFVNGRTMQLVNINNQPVGPDSACITPKDQTHPVAVNVSGTIKYTRWEGSSVTATICVNGTDFVLKPNSYFVISKNKNDTSADDPNDEP